MSENDRHPSAEFNIHADADGNWDDETQADDEPEEATASKRKATKTN
jgi:hypothetical protein